jgi:diguanylate cyclase (GGDEF)-like protein
VSGLVPMKKHILAIILFSAVVPALAAQTAMRPPITSIRALHSLSNEEADKGLPVAFEATVTYIRNYERTLFVQDGDDAIFVLAPTDAAVKSGDRVLIKGTTGGSFRPIVVSSSITLLHHGERPTAVAARYDDLIHSRLDCRLVKVVARVRAADPVLSSDRKSTSLEISEDGNDIDVVVDSDDPAALGRLLDAEVEVTGAISGRFDGKMQQTGVLMHVTSLADIKILKPPPSDPWSLPITPMDQIIGNSRVKDLTQRVRVQGTITYYHPGTTIVLQSGSKSLLVMTLTRNDLHVGDVADVIGFPVVHDGFLGIERGEVTDSHIQAPVSPLPATWRLLSSSKNIFDLVSVEGQVVMEVREAAQDEYVLVEDGQLFSAIYRHEPATSNSPFLLTPMKNIAIGSKVRVAGICIPEDSNPFNSQVPFNILLRDFNDIEVIANPSWVNVRNLLILVSVLLVLVVAVSVWIGLLGRKVRRQTMALSASVEAEAATERRMAQLELRRSRVLENVNGSVPLAEVIEEIAEMTSFRLNGAACWCEIEDGARLGYFPPEPNDLRVIQVVIPSRDGPPLGRIFAGIPPTTPASETEEESLLVGARLATLAIETRRLYSDLLHRSEFDLLTDIHNRFSLDKHLDQLIEEARKNAGIFGLIYIDLNDFKQVNDLYGHHIGDLYLQEVAKRMKNQLRMGDQLARLGGDEFAALLPNVRHQTDVDEIAQRLERCFDAPFAADNYSLRGSASIGVAIYPNDGITKNSLLSAADAAMYERKHAMRRAAGQEEAPHTGSAKR